MLKGFSGGLGPACIEFLFEDLQANSATANDNVKTSADRGRPAQESGIEKNSLETLNHN
jgi:hypothetical protein